MAKKISMYRAYNNQLKAREYLDEKDKLPGCGDEGKWDCGELPCSLCPMVGKNLHCLWLHKNEPRAEIQKDLTLIKLDRVRLERAYKMILKEKEEE